MSKRRASMHDDGEVLRSAIKQVVNLNVSREGWREGVLYFVSPKNHSTDMLAGESLVKRGILIRDPSGRLRLSEAALIRILRVAIDASVCDLLINDPPDGKLPPCPDYCDDGPQRLILDYENKPAIRG